MAGETAAAWAQAYLSAAAVLVSGAVAVFVPWNERRISRKLENKRRLAIECKRSRSGGLEIAFTYLPAFQNYAVGISLQVIEPSDARVYKGVITKQIGADGLLSFHNAIGGLGENVRYNAVSLLRTGEPNVSREAHRGAMFVEYPDEREGPYRSKVKVDVLIHGNFRVSSRIIELTAIDDHYYARGGPIAVIKADDMIE